MWDVLFHRQAIKHIRKLPPKVIEKLDIWVDIAQREGSVGLRAFPGFKDEALTGDWKGYRSSRLSRQYRVIYAVRKNVVEIFVIDVTTHDYRRS
jgi:addiction module RelE/StbE family toxin